MIDLKPACRRTIEIVGGVADDRLAFPTPCTEYTVGDLVDHLDAVSQGFTDLARKLDDEQPATDAGGEPIAAVRRADDWRDSVAEHVRALGEAWDDQIAWQGNTSAAELDLPNEMWGKIALTEVAVHGWDLASVTDQPFDLPRETLRACLDHVADFVPNAPTPELWGSAVDVLSDAPLLDQVVAITGRTGEPQ